MMNYGLGNAMMGGSAADGAPQGLGGMMQQPNVPQQMMQKKKPGFDLLSSGLLGLLPMLLGKGGIPGAMNSAGVASPLGMGAAGQLGGLLAGLFKK